MNITVDFCPRTYQAARQIETIKYSELDYNRISLGRLYAILREQTIIIELVHIQVQCDILPSSINSIIFFPQ